MRLSLFGLALVIAAAFLIGRATDPPAAPAAAGRVFTGRMGDVFRVPTAVTQCVVSKEAGAPNVICRHLPTAEARYSVVFYRDNVLVYRNGRPDDPVFSAQGKP